MEQRVKTLQDNIDEIHELQTKVQEVKIEKKFRTLENGAKR